MSETLPFFDAVAVRTVPPELVTCGFPFFLVAYWPAGKYFKVFGQMYSDTEGTGITGDIKSMQAKGWTRITVCRLPVEDLTK